MCAPAGRQKAAVQLPFGPSERFSSTDSMLSMSRMSGAAALLSLLLISSSATAQSMSSGSLRGIVQGAGGAPVPGAMLTLVHEASGVSRTVSPGGSGRFAFSVLAPGEYSLRAEHFGYRPHLITGLLVRPGVRLDLPVELSPVDEQVEAIDTTWFEGAVLAGARPGLSTELSAGRLRDYPTERRELTEIARHSSLSSGDLEMQGLPAWLSGIRVDGTAVGTLESASLVPGSFRTAALPLAMFEQASLSASNPDVEWSSAGGSLDAFTARGGRGRGVEAFGAVGEDLIQGGFHAGGSIVPDTASFLVGVEASRITRGAPFTGIADPEVDPVQWVAREVYGIGPGAETTTDRLSAYANVAWQVSANSQIDTRASFATLPSASGELFEVAGAGIGRTYDGRDLFVGTTLTTRLGDGVINEFRLSMDGASRNFDDADPLGIVSPTHILSSGSALGPAGIRPRSFSRTTLRASDAVHITRGDHLLKLGLAGNIGWHAAEQGIIAETFFSDANAFESGQAYAVRTESPGGESEFAISQVALFAQDTWSVGSGLDLLFGARLDMERLPSREVGLNQEWFELTGLDNRDVGSSWMRVSPRIGFNWDLQNRHEWVLSGSGGIYSGSSDPLLLASWIAGDGDARVFRGTVSWNGWPSDPALGQDAAPTLMLLDRSFQAPRSIRGDIGISRLIGSGTVLRVAGLYRHTDFLPRASDLNLSPDAVTTDQFGRPVFGELAQLGGILYAEGRSNRRFSEFDQVVAVNSDGWSTYRGITATLERRSSEDFEAFASYTFSRTEDNWAPTGHTAAGTDLPPLVDGSGDWMEGVSSFDVPHRAVLGMEAGVPVLAGLRAAVLYRFTSGAPFTPGFRAGVDANADGSWRNDPAFIDPEIPGTEELLAEWSCLSSQRGAFAERNSCRAASRHSVDARLSIGFARLGRYSAALLLDALNLAASDRSIPDSALYLVDPAGEITIDDESGRLNVPLVANQNFGRSLGLLQQGRSLRLGIRVSY